MEKKFQILNHFAIHQKLIQYYESTMFQLKKKKYCSNHQKAAQVINKYSTKIFQNNIFEIIKKKYRSDLSS